MRDIPINVEGDLKHQILNFLGADTARNVIAVRRKLTFLVRGVLNRGRK